MINKTEKKAQRKSGLITFIATAIILVALFLLKFQYYYPPIEDAIVVNFGYKQTGKNPLETSFSKNRDISQNKKATLVNKSAQKKEQKKQTDPFDNQVVTQKEKAPIVIPSSKKKSFEKKQKINSNQKQQKISKKEETKEKVDTAEKQVQKLDVRFKGLRKALNDKGKKPSTSDGKDTKNANQGILEGFTNTKNYEASIAKGTRKLIFRPIMPDFNQCPNNEYGKLVVSYQVNNLGNVINNSLMFSGRGTNISVNSCIKELIKNYLIRFKYEPSKKDFEQTSQTFNIRPL